MGLRYDFQKSFAQTVVFSYDRIHRLERRRKSTECPFSAIANTHAGQILLFAGRLTEAIEQLTKAIDLDPYLPLGYFWIGFGYLHVGRLQEAMEAADQAARNFWKPLAVVIPVLVRQGKLHEARHIVAELEQTAKIQYEPPSGIAGAHAAAGNVDAAAAWLEEAFIQRDPGLPFIKLIGPAGLKDVLADERIQAIIRKVGLS